MSNAQIKDLMVNHLLTLAVVNIDIVKPDEPYKTKVGRTYMETMFQPGQSNDILVPNNAPKQYQGFLQVTVVAPRAGVDAAWSLVDQVIAHFKKGTRFNGSPGVQFKMTRTPWASPPIPDEGWLRIPVTIPYSCMA